MTGANLLFLIRKFHMLLSELALSFNHIKIVKVDKFKIAGGKRLSKSLIQ